jgi:putative addiction module component (TIGR02574 family)
MPSDIAKLIQKLTIPERIVLVEEIWDSIARENEAFKLTKTQKEELERRSKSFKQGRTWEEIKSEFLHSS